MAALRIALPKGRLLDEIFALWVRAGLLPTPPDLTGRRLVHPMTLTGVGPVEVLVVRGSDTPVYVAHGSCHLGVAGYDVIQETAPDVYVPLDLGLGPCRMALAAPAGHHPFRRARPTIATKFPRVARSYFEAKARACRIVELKGAIETAPLVGLADAIVDLVETGRTLRANGLEPLDTLFDVSSRLMVNPSALRLRTDAIDAFTGALAPAITTSEPS